MPITLQVLSGGLHGRSFTFDQPEVWLGRDPSCEVAFDPQKDDSVGKSHACIWSVAGGGYCIENIHDNGTLLNGTPVNSAQSLKSGDILRLAPDGPEICVTVNVARQSEPAVSSISGPSICPTQSAVRRPAQSAVSSGGWAKGPLLYVAAIVVPIVTLFVVLLTQHPPQPTVIVNPLTAAPGGPTATLPANGNAQAVVPSVETTDAQRPAEPDPVEIDKEVSRDRLAEAILQIELEQREALVEQRAILQKEQQRLQQLLETQRWALSNFEVSERGLIPQPKRVSDVMQRWQKGREAHKQKFLTMPDESRGDIASGRALNFFLEVCGTTALKHSLYRARGDDRADEVLDTITKVLRLEPDEVRDVCYYKGLARDKIKGRLNSDPFPLDWPYVLLTESKYDPFRKSLESARETALEELGSGDGIRASTQKELVTSVQSLKSTFDSDRVALVRERRAYDQTMAQWYAGKRFVDSLGEGVYRLAAAKKRSDIEGRYFVGGTVEDLMAHMCRSGLQFAPADPGGESTYKVIYDMMVAYYADLYALHLATSQTEKKLNLSEGDERRLMETQFAMTQNAFRDYGSAKPSHESPMRKLIGIMDDINTGVEFAKNVKQGYDSLFKDKCKSCDTPLSANAKFCPNCSARR